MAKYHEGDVVVVRYDLEEQYYPMEDDPGNNNYATRGMCARRGQEVTIDKIAESNGQYYIVEDEHVCYWTDGMFEDIPESFDLPTGLLDFGEVDDG